MQLLDNPVLFNILWHCFKFSLNAPRRVVIGFTWLYEEHQLRRRPDSEPASGRILEWRSLPGSPLPRARPFPPAPRWGVISFKWGTARAVIISFQMSRQLPHTGHFTEMRQAAWQAGISISKWNALPRKRLGERAGKLSSLAVSCHHQLSSFRVGREKESSCHH